VSVSICNVIIKAKGITACWLLLLLSITASCNFIKESLRSKRADGRMLCGISSARRYADSKQQTSNEKSHKRLLTERNPKQKRECKSISDNAVYNLQQQQQQNIQSFTSSIEHGFRNTFVPSSAPYV
jgi:hypothetical protein